MEDSRLTSTGKINSSFEFLIPAIRRSETRLNEVRNFEVRPDDVWICANGRSGTTWTQEMVWLICNNCDIDTARKVKKNFRFPCLEASKKDGPADMMKYLQDLSSPRFIKTHCATLPEQLWEVNPKIVTVYRDPRDVAISYFYYLKMFFEFTDSMEDFFDYFLEYDGAYHDYWKSVLNLWDRRNQENVLFLTYAEMKKDLRCVILKTAKFFNKELNEEQITRMMDYLDINAMKANPAINKEDIVGIRDEERFIRKGETEGWRTILSDEYKEKFNCWAKKNIEGTHFPYYLF